jgi:hypothetical protein
VNRTSRLVHGLDNIGGTKKRIVLLAMAAYAHANGSVRTSDRRLRDATELGRDAFMRITQQLENEGWLRREERGFTVAIAKLEASQRVYANAADNAAEPENQRFPTINLGASVPLNRQEREITQ